MIRYLAMKVLWRSANFCCNEASHLNSYMMKELAYFRISFEVCSNLLPCKWRLYFCSWEPLDVSFGFL